MPSKNFNNTSRTSAQRSRRSSPKTTVNTDDKTPVPIPIEEVPKIRSRNLSTRTFENINNIEDVSPLNSTTKFSKELEPLDSSKLRKSIIQENLEDIEQPQEIEEEILESQDVQDSQDSQDSQEDIIEPQEDIIEPQDIEESSEIIDTETIEFVQLDYFNGTISSIANLIYDNFESYWSNLDPNGIADFLEGEKCDEILDNIRNLEDDENLIDNAVMMLCDLIMKKVPVIPNRKIYDIWDIYRSPVAQQHLLSAASWDDNDNIVIPMSYKGCSFNVTREKFYCLSVIIDSFLDDQRPIFSFLGNDEFDFIDPTTNSRYDFPDYYEPRKSGNVTVLLSEPIDGNGEKLPKSDIYFHKIRFSDAHGIKFYSSDDKILEAFILAFRIIRNLCNMSLKDIGKYFCGFDLDNKNKQIRIQYKSSK